MLRQMTMHWRWKPEAEGFLGQRVCEEVAFGTHTGPPRPSWHLVADGMIPSPPLPGVLSLPDGVC